MTNLYENITGEVQAEAMYNPGCHCHEQCEPCEKKTKEICITEKLELCSQKCYTCEVVCRRKIFEPPMKITKCYPECPSEPCRCCCCCNCCQQ